jgi:hypothetical protein
MAGGGGDGGTNGGGFEPGEVVGILEIIGYAERGPREGDCDRGPFVLGLEVLTIPILTAVSGGPRNCLPPSSEPTSD